MNNKPVMWKLGVTIDEKQFVNLWHQPLLRKRAAEANEFLNKFGVPETAKGKSKSKIVTN